MGDCLTRPLRESGGSEKVPWARGRGSHSPATRPLGQGALFRISGAMASRGGSSDSPARAKSFFRISGARASRGRASGSPTRPLARKLFLPRQPPAMGAPDTLPRSRNIFRDDAQILRSFISRDYVGECMESILNISLVRGRLWGSSGAGGWRFRVFPLGAPLSHAGRRAGERLDHFPARPGFFLYR